MNKKEFLEKWGYQPATGYGSALFDCRNRLEEDLNELLKSSTMYVINDAKGKVDGVALSEQVAISYIEDWNKTVEDTDDKVRYDTVECVGW